MQLEANPVALRTDLVPNGHSPGATERPVATERVGAFSVATQTNSIATGHEPVASRTDLDANGHNPIAARNLVSFRSVDFVS